MHKILFASLALASLSFTPVSAAVISDATKCASEIEIVKQLDADSDVGPKFEPLVKDLIGVLEHLCSTKAYPQAEDVASTIRGMLATE